MSHYILTAQAKQDLKEIKDYILTTQQRYLLCAESPGTRAQQEISKARRFVQAFRQQCQLIARFPEIGRSYSQLAPALRGFPLENYIIFYRPAAKGIEVERLLSGYPDLEALLLEAEE